MATNYTSLLGFALPTTGELSGTWGDTVNNSITELVEDAIAATATASVTSGNWTLSTTGSGASNEARCAILIPTGTPGVSRDIYAPKSSKAYIVINQSDAAVVLRGGPSTPTTGITITAGNVAIVAWNGSDFVNVSSGDVDGPGSATDNAIVRFDGTSGKLIQNSPVTIADTTGNMAGVGTLSSGAITSSSLTSTRVLYAGASGLIQDSANLTFNGTVLTSTGFSGPLNGTVGATTPATGAFTTVNGMTITTSTGTFTLTNGKTFAVQNTLTFAGTDSTTMTFPSTTTTVVGTDVTQTLTNKRINPRAVVAGATSGSLTINGDTTDLYEAEGLTGAITFLQPSGTPVDGQRLIIRIEDNGSARGITWTTTSGAFRAVGVTLPTTTTASKVTYVGCIYNATDVFWDVIATVTQA